MRVVAERGSQPATLSRFHHRFARRVAASALIASWAGVAVLPGGCGHSAPGGGAGAAAPLEVVATLGGLGDTPGRFAFPRAIDVSADGRTLWVIDRSARVQRIDPETGRCLALWKMPESDLGKPVGFCVSPGLDEAGRWCDELLYIADTHYHRVMVYRPPTVTRDELPPGAPLPEPVLVGRFGSYGQEPGQFILPTDVAVLFDATSRKVERIYVGEYGGNDRITVFDGSYRLLFTFGHYGMGSQHEALAPDKVAFARPQSLMIEEIDGQRMLIVTDSANHRIGRFTLDGQLIGWFGAPELIGDGPGQFRFPFGLASLHDGTALVSEFGGNRLQRIDLRTGKGLGTWGRAGRGEGELATPWAVAVLGRRTYVVDSGNNRVLAIETPRRR